MKGKVGKDHRAAQAMEKTGSGGETGGRTLGFLQFGLRQWPVGTGNLTLPGSLTDSERPSSQPNGKGQDLPETPRFHFKSLI